MEKAIVIVVDTNILFTFFWKNSFSPELLNKKRIHLIAPELSFKEIKKHSDEIIKKAKISKKEYGIIMSDLFLGVLFFPETEYSDHLDKATKKCPDKDDIDFFALALKYKCPLWSNDQKLKEQDAVEIINTKELIELLD
ncbi:MAG: PIN domain-containing protein [Candidatus Woesearchaeota archaeon]